MDIRKKLFHILFSSEEHLLAKKEAMLAKAMRDKRVLQNIVESQNKRNIELQRKVEQIEKECRHNIEEANLYKKFFEKAGRILNESKKGT